MVFPKGFYFSMMALFIIPLLSGCSAGTVISKSAAFAVSKYCTVPEGGRTAIRKVVSRAVSPNSIVITCLGD